WKCEEKIFGNRREVITTEHEDPSGCASNIFKVLPGHSLIVRQPYPAPISYWYQPIRILSVLIEVIVVALYPKPSVTAQTLVEAPPEVSVDEECDRVMRHFRRSPPTRSLQDPLRNPRQVIQPFRQ